jgi:hypothetical protein
MVHVYLTYETPNGKPLSMPDCYPLILYFEDVEDWQLVTKEDIEIKIGAAIMSSDHPVSPSDYSGVEWAWLVSSVH